MIRMDPTRTVSGATSTKNYPPVSAGLTGLPTVLVPVRALMAITLLALSACATAADNTTSGTSVSSSIENEYKISPEDVLDISVWREEELTREVTVRPDGGISYPLVGNISAANKTAAQLEADLKVRLAEYIPDAVVSVVVKEIRGLKIFVTGQVRKPGQFLVGRYVDVLQAITLAGGLSPFADKRKIRIIRRSGGAETVFTFNYSEVQKGARLEQNILLLPGDTVIVP